MSKILRAIVAARSFEDGVLFARILAFALVLPLILRLKLETVASLVEPRRPRPAASLAVVEKIGRYTSAICNSRLIRGQCLALGLMRYRFLRWAGLPVSLVFGVGERDGNIVAHCWLLNDGLPFMEPSDPCVRFKAIVSFPVGLARGR